MWTRADLKSKAKEDLRAGYWALVVMAMIMQFLTGGGGGGSSSSSSVSEEEFADSFNSLGSAEALSTLLVILGIVGSIVLVALIIGMLLGLFVYNPLVVGVHRYFITATYKDATFSDYNCLGHSFKRGNYMNTVKVMFLRGLYTFLWSLLFVIPGIIKAYEYRMIPYILAEDPEMLAEDAFRLSKEMMDGNKWDTFVLELSFLGWHILSVFTCGLLSVFYVNPYMYMTYTQLYETLKHRASMDYYDHSIAGNGYTYSNSYGNPGAYAQANPYSDAYTQTSAPSYASGETFNPSAPVDEGISTDNPYDDPYKLPENNE